MTSGGAWKADLEALDPSEWPSYLNARSGLPGPRANLTLVQDVAVFADAGVIDALSDDGREYSMMCAAAAVARRAKDPEFSATARALAADERWRVREGVAIGLQLLGDTDTAVLIATVLRWVDDPDLFVQRAAAAAICEPRLLRTRDAATAAIEVCRRATQHLQALPPERRRDPDARSLRKALGYCWSVAVAADASVSLDVFRALDTTDPDVAWIVKENRRKKRLSTLL